MVTIRDQTTNATTKKKEEKKHQLTNRSENY
jgi:hypothetical protein